MTDKDRQHHEKGEEFAATYKISQTKQILFHAHESEVQITNDKN